jgi:hypothetical protein
MKSEDKPLSYFITGKKQACAPLYQRRYRWNEGKARIFWDDLYSLVRDAGKRHFLGTMVATQPEENDGFISFTVIDGQQRLITLNLYVAALGFCLRKVMADAGATVDTLAQFDAGRDEAEDLKLKDLFSRSFSRFELSNDDEPKNVYKFKPTHWDDKNFQAIVGSDSSSDERTNLFSVWEMFKQEIGNILSSCGGSSGSQLNAKLKVIDDLLQTLCRMDVVFCKLRENSGDDPHQVFESINSKGERLSSTDLIRNYALMGLNAQEQKRCYAAYWKPIEEKLTPSDDNEVPSSLFQDFMKSLLAMRGVAVTNSSVFPKFKQEFGAGRGVSLEDLQYIHRYSQLCRKIVAIDPANDHRLNRKIRGLNYLGFTTPLPLLLKYMGNGRPTEEQLSEVLFLLERYFVRRSLMNEGLHTMADFFAMLTKLYVPAEVTAEAFPAWLADKLRSAKLTMGQGEQAKIFECPERAPDDARIKEKLPTQPIYRINRNVTAYILAVMEIRKNAESDLSEDSREIPDGIWEYDVEHVMPQEPSLWRDDICKWNSKSEYERAISLEAPAKADELDRIFEILKPKVEDHLDIIGNLTLTAYNRPMKNSRFCDKVRSADDASGKQGGLSKSRLHMNSIICAKQTWSFVDIQLRSKELAELFIKIWPQI